MAETADLLYMPALHQGYVNYLDRRRGSIGILDQSIVLEVPRMERDIRAVGGEVMARVVQAVYPNRVVGLVTPDNIGNYHMTRAGIYMPDEDVSRAVAEQYLEGVNIAFEPTFLRWDRHTALAEVEVNPDRIITEDEAYQELMRIAESEGQKSPDWWRQVGALIVKDGQIMFQGHNRPYPTEHGSLETFGDPRSSFDYGERADLSRCMHAEAGLVARAAREGISLEGSELVVNVYPCPSCAKTVSEAGIRKVYYQSGYSLLDVDDTFKAKGVEVILVQSHPTRANTAGEPSSPDPETS